MCEVQIRAHAEPVTAFAQLVDGELVIRPEHPLVGVATGQSAVVYAGTRVLGQCHDRSHRASRSPRPSASLILW